MHLCLCVCVYAYSLKMNLIYSMKQCKFKYLQNTYKSKCLFKMFFENILFPSTTWIFFLGSSEFPEKEVFKNNWKEKILFRFLKSCVYLSMFPDFLAQLDTRCMEIPAFYKALLLIKDLKWELKFQGVSNASSIHTEFSISQKKVIIHPI